MAIPIPIHFEELVQQYDLTTKITMDQRVNVVVQDLRFDKLQNPDSLVGVISAPDRLHSNIFHGTDGTPVKSNLPGKAIRIFAEADQLTKMHRAQKVYIHQAVTKQVRGIKINIHDDTLVIPLNDNHRKQMHPHMWSIEQFSGGFGGWHFAARFLEKYNHWNTRTLAIDHSMESAVQFGLTHGFVIVGDPSNMPKDQLHAYPENTVVCCDIASTKWQQILQDIMPRLWTISGPCISWSSAGLGKGFFASEGMTIVHSFGQIRIFRPPVVGFEQVSAFPSHDHFEVFMQLVKWAGYRVVFADNFELAKVTPCRRNRWLALLVAQEHEWPECKIPTWPSHKTTPLTFDAPQQLSEEEMKQHQPSFDSASHYFNDKLMPGRGRTWTKQQILQYRLPNLQQAIPTFMAAYTEQHNINMSHLMEKGLYGFFQRQHNSFRFFTPTEASLLHGLPEALILLKPRNLAFKAIGNAIAPAHALYILVPAMQMLGDIPAEVEAGAEVLAMITERIRLSNIDQRQDDYAWYVGPASATAQLQSHLQFFIQALKWELNQKNVWPANHFFHPQQGLQNWTVNAQCQPTVIDSSIEPTVQFDVEYWIMPALIPGEYGKLCIDPYLTWWTIMQSWQFQVIPQGLSIDLDTLDTPISCTGQTNMLMIPFEDKHVDVILEAQQTLKVKSTILVREQEHLHMYGHAKGEHWSQICKRYLGIPPVAFDALGKLKDDTKQFHGDIVPSQIDVQQDKLFLSNIQAALQVKTTVRLLDKTDILQIDCTGDDDCREGFLNIWTSPQNQQWMESKGRQMNYQDLGPNHWQILLRPKLPKAALPSVQLREAFFLRLIQIAFASLQAPDPAMQQVPCEIHYIERELGQFLFPAIMQFDLLAVILQHFQVLLGSEYHVQIGRDSQTSHCKDLKECQMITNNAIVLQLSPCDVTALPAIEDRFDDPKQELFAPTQFTVYHLHNHQGYYLNYQGDQIQLQSYHAIWNSSEIQEHLHNHRFQMQMAQTDDTLSLVLKPTEASIQESFLPTLCSILFRQASASLNRLGGYVTFALFGGKQLCQIEFPILADLTAFHHVTQWSFRLLHPTGSMKICIDGERCHPTMKVANLVDKSLFNPRLRFDLEEPMSGGAPTKWPGNKQEFHRDMETQLATYLLENGVNLPQVPQYVTKLVDNAGYSSLHQLFQLPTTDDFQKSMDSLCQQHGVQLPMHNPKKMKTQAKVHRQKAHEQSLANMYADPSQYSLAPGFFVNADKTPANLLTQFSPSTTGVMLASADSAKEWIKVSNDLVADELALFVLGPLEVPDRFSFQSIQAPAKDKQNRDVILQGTLVQFGVKDIGTSIEEQVQIDTPQTQIIAFTLWKSDHDPTMWKRMTEAPVRTTQHLLALDGHQGLITKVWGRTFHASGAPTEPNKALSIQFHTECLVGPRLQACLRRSGFNKIHMQPKSPTGQPDNQWRIVWLGKECHVQEIEAKVASLPGIAGFVTSKRGTGIRVESSHFDHVYTKLHPGTPIPSQEDMKHVFRLQPLPHGVNAEVLKTWALENYSWKVKPLKPVGAKQWILAANEAPEGIVAFNGSPLLIHQLPQKSTRGHGAIAAGPKPKPPSRPSVLHPEPANTFKMGEPMYDPWQPYMAQKTISADTAAATTPGTSSTERSLQGPIAERMQQQDAKIQAMETTVKQLRDEQSQRFHKIDQQNHQLETQLQAHTQQTQQGIDFLKNEYQGLQKTVQDSMAKQEKKLTDTFDDLKQLLLRGQKRGADFGEAGSAMMEDLL